MDEIHFTLAQRHGVGFSNEIEKICQKYENVPLDTAVVSVESGLITEVRGKDAINRIYYNGKVCSSDEDSAHLSFTNESLALDDDSILGNQSVYEDGTHLKSYSNKSPLEHSVFNLDDCSDDCNVSVLAASHMKAISNVCTEICKNSINKTAYENVDSESSNTSGSEGFSSAIEGLCKTSDLIESNSDNEERKRPFKLSGTQPHKKCFKDFRNGLKTSGFDKNSHLKNVGAGSTLKSPSLGFKYQKKSTLSSKKGKEDKHGMSQQIVKTDFSSSDGSCSDPATRLSSGIAVSQSCGDDSFMYKTSNSSRSANKTTNTLPHSRNKEKASRSDSTGHSVDLLDSVPISYCSSNTGFSDRTTNSSCASKDEYVARTNLSRSPSIVLSSPLRKINLSSKTLEKTQRGNRTLSHPQRHGNNLPSKTKTSTSVSTRSSKENGKKLNSSCKVATSKISKTLYVLSDADSSSDDDWFHCKKSNKLLTQLPSKGDASDDDFIFQHSPIHNRSTSKHTRSFKHNAPLKVGRTSESSTVTSSDSSEEQPHVTSCNSFEKPTSKSCLRRNSKHNRVMTFPSSDDDFTSCSDELTLQHHAVRNPASKSTRKAARTRSTSLKNVRRGSSQSSQRVLDSAIKIKSVFAKDKPNSFNSCDERSKSTETDQKNTLDKRFDVRSVKNGRNLRHKYNNQGRSSKQPDKENTPFDVLEYVGENKHDTDKTNTCGDWRNTKKSPKYLSTQRLEQTAMVLRSGKKIR